MIVMIIIYQDNQDARPNQDTYNHDNHNDN